MRVTYDRCALKALSDGFEDDYVSGRQAYADETGAPVGLDHVIKEIAYRVDGVSTGAETRSRSWSNMQRQLASWWSGYLIRYMEEEALDVVEGEWS